MNRDDPTEIQLKAAVLNRLVKREGLGRDAIVVNELPLGRTSVRADLVVLRSTNQICGIEIKSDRDSLTRLERQLGVYQEYFDRVILVVGQRHIKRALKPGFEDMEVWLARQDCSIEIVQSASAARTATKSGRDLLTQQQAKRATEDERQAYCDALRSRFAQTSVAFWNATEHREVGPADLRLLSRFEELRTQVTKARAQRESMWNEWANFFARQKSVHSSSVS